MPDEERRALSLIALDGRLRVLETRTVTDDILHKGLIMADSQTAQAIERLTAAINDPRAGLIVELDKFRAEVAADRAAFRSWVRGATFVVSAVFAIFTVVAPWIREILAAGLGLPRP